ncbi:MAG: hypothetical protein ACYDDE_08665 [bacterium]
MSEARFDNIEEFLIDINNFIENKCIDLSDFKWIEPIALSIIKALIELNPDFKFIQSSSQECNYYFDIMQNNNYDSTYIPLSVIKSGLTEKFVNKIIEKIIMSTPYKNGLAEEVTKENMSDYLKYAIAELINNARQHALSPIGVVVAAQYFPKIKKTQVVVTDCGIGFYKTLCSYYNIASESDALIESLKKGVTGGNIQLYGTRDNVGGGLYYLHTILNKTNGKLLMISNDGILKSANGKTNAAKTKYLWKGSIVGFEFSENNITSSFEDFLYEHPW